MRDVLRKRTANSLIFLTPTLTPTLPEDREETQHKGTKTQRSEGNEMCGKSLSLSLSLSKDREFRIPFCLALALSLALSFLSFI